MNRPDITAYIHCHWRGLWSSESLLPLQKLREERGAALQAHHRLVARHAPHWLEEYDVIDQGFGWKPGTAEAVAHFGEKLTAISHECTSWIVMPDLAADGRLILHKNRDSEARALGLMRLAAPGKHPWLGLGNLGQLVPCMGVNASGLAVVMNSAPICDANRDQGFTTPELCRLLLEECQDCDSALALLGQLLDDGAYTHGNRGSIWMLADPRHAAFVENTAQVHAECRLHGGLAIRANTWHLPELIPHIVGRSAEALANFKRELAVRRTLLPAGDDGIGLERVFAAARLRQTPRGHAPICRKTTCCATTFTLDANAPEILSTAWFAFGPPAHTVFLPIPIGLAELPEELYDGTCAAAAFRRQRQDLLSDARPYIELERQLHRRHQEALAAAAGCLKARRRAAAQAAIASAFQDNWRQAREMLFE